MEKPLSIRRKEFMEKLASSINESQLPACVVLDVLQLIVAQVSDLATQQLNADMEEYRQALLKESEEE